MYSLKKVIPAVAGSIAFIDPFVGCDIKQSADVSNKMQPGNFKVLAQYIPQRPRLHGFIQIVNGSPNLVYLHLNNLLMGIRQGKDLDRYTDLFQSKDLVQNKGL